MALSREKIAQYPDVVARRLTNAEADKGLVLTGPATPALLIESFAAQAKARDIRGSLDPEANVRYNVVHGGVPIGFVELAFGELVAGALAPLPAFDPLRDTIRAGSNALLALGFFGAATAAGQNGAGAALRSAAALQFDLVTDRGDLVATTFVNLLEAPDGGVVVLARFGHAHAAVAARVQSPPRGVPEHERPKTSDPDV